MASSSAHFQNTSVVLNDLNCPYYQLYGPPPSYETVIAQSRGKTFDSIITNERPRTNGDQSLNIQYNSPILRCYAHSLQPNTHNNLSQNNCNSYFGDNNCHRNDIVDCPESSTSSTANAVSMVNEVISNVPESQESPLITGNNGKDIKKILYGSLPTLCQRLNVPSSPSSCSIAPPRLHSCSSFRHNIEVSTDLEQYFAQTSTSSPSQINPSDNVILTRSSDSIVVNNLADNQQPTSSCTLSNNHCRNVESKCKLDRSKSLV